MEALQDILRINVRIAAEVGSRKAGLEEGPLRCLKQVCAYLATPQLRMWE